MGKSVLLWHCMEGQSHICQVRIPAQKQVNRIFPAGYENNATSASQIAHIFLLFSKHFSQTSIHLFFYLFTLSLQGSFGSPFLKSELTQGIEPSSFSSVTCLFIAVQVGIQEGCHQAVEEMSWGNTLRASAVASKGQKQLEGGDLLGHQRAGFSKVELIYTGHKTPQGEGRAQLNRQARLESRPQTPLEQKFSICRRKGHFQRLLKQRNILLLQGI